MKNTGIETAAIRSSSATLGHPIRSLLQAAVLSEQLGQPLAEGEVVLLGAATEAVPIFPGQVIRAEIQQLGSVGFQTSGEKV
jgi:2-oxo-3-hexenedioate decarboxylase